MLMNLEANISLKSTIWIGLFHGVGVHHLPDQLHRVVQELSSLDLSSGTGFNLLKLSQEVTGSESAFRPRLFHPGKPFSVSPFLRKLII